MLLHAREGHAERRGQVRDRSVPAPELPQNAASRDVRKRGKRGIERILNHVVQYSTSRRGAQGAPDRQKRAPPSVVGGSKFCAARALRNAPKLAPPSPCGLVEICECATCARCETSPSKFRGGGAQPKARWVLLCSIPWSNAPRNWRHPSLAGGVRNLHALSKGQRANFAVGEARWPKGQLWRAGLACCTQDQGKHRVAVRSAVRLKSGFSKCPGRNGM